MSLIAVEDLSVRYGGKTVLREVDLAVHPGEIVTIVGPNGSGKTRALRLKPESFGIPAAVCL